jgi:3-dehydroquinate synthase
MKHRILELESGSSKSLLQTPPIRSEFMKTVNVALGARSYPIHVGEGLLAQSPELIRMSAGTRAIIVTNPTVASHHLETLARALTRAGVRHDAITIPDGESHKTWSTLYEIHTRLLELGAERSTLLIALGGGVVGDLAGFAAATYQRGMSLVQIPTTLLAQVDSSVGGKTAVNHPLGKNMIGAFYQPDAVIIDTLTLSTLPQREYCAGVAEVIKYGAIRSLAFFEWLEANIDALLARDRDAVAHAVLESCRIKAEIVAVDERETGERALLNFGHTFGHAIETGEGYGTWLHGEAVAAGMVLAAELSVEANGLARKAADRLRDLIERAKLPVRAATLGADRYLELMGRDKKVKAGAIRFVLLAHLGRAVVRGDITVAQVRQLIAAAHA